MSRLNSRKKSKHYHHGNLRKAAIEKAMILLEQSSASSLSMRSLAKEIGVSPNALLHHFSNKQKMLLAIASEGFRRVAEMEKEVFCSQQNVMNRLINLATLYVESAKARPQLYRLMMGDGLDGPPYSTEFMEARKSAFSYLEQVLTEFLQKEKFLQKLPIAIVGAWSMVHGITRLYIDNQINPGQDALPDIQELLRVLCISYLQGLKDSHFC